jgi:hypothetical protein
VALGIALTLPISRNGLAPRPLRQREEFANGRRTPGMAAAATPALTTDRQSSRIPPRDVEQVDRPFPRLISGPSIFVDG